jgi:hypothetical protein
MLNLPKIREFNKNSKGVPESISGTPFSKHQNKI